MTKTKLDGWAKTAALVEKYGDVARPCFAWERLPGLYPMEDLELVIKPGTRSYTFEPAGTHKDYGEMVRIRTVDVCGDPECECMSKVK